MEPEKSIWNIIILLALMFLISDRAYAETMMYTEPENDTDSVLSVPVNPVAAATPICFADHFRKEPRVLHQIGLEVRPEYIIPTIEFLDGHNYNNKPIDFASSVHLKYSFKFRPNSVIDRIYGGVYQGIGVSYFDFGEPQQLGNPFAVYLFQGARIARISPRVSLNYEWNFGLSFKWKQYDQYENEYNTVIGSDVNAYLNVNFYFNWMLSSAFDLTAGYTLAHFSNGNTKFPNAGLNTMGLKVGLIYNINRKPNLMRPLFQPPLPGFKKHISYDLALFGAWRRKGVILDDQYTASPHSYTVAGFNFAPMYNFGYRFRAGLSLDGYYDGSANVYGNHYYSGDSDSQFATPPLKNQLALGVSARGEYVMPYFSVNVGLGTNFLHGGGDLKGLYQILALKVDVTKHSYLHIGYCLKDFHLPNFLMLGIGFRFNNKNQRLNY